MVSVWRAPTGAEPRSNTGESLQWVVRSRPCWLTPSRRVTLVRSCTPAPRGPEPPGGSTERHAKDGHENGHESEPSRTRPTT